MAKPILCLDFDGVIHDYREGWKDGSIYGELTPGFIPWAAKAKELFSLVVFTSRARTPEDCAKVADWLGDKLSGHEAQLELKDFAFSATKPPAFLTIDDRAMTFAGDWSRANLDPGILIAFRTWTQK